MPNMAAAIKGEIARLAKKEAKSATSQLKRASVQYRSDIAITTCIIVSLLLSGLMWLIRHFTQ